MGNGVGGRVPAARLGVPGPRAESCLVDVAMLVNATSGAMHPSGVGGERDRGGVRLLDQVLGECKTSFNSCEWGKYECQPASI